MLKIKDNVDLKELEKYGFKLNQWDEYSEDDYSKIICAGRRGQCFELIVFNGDNRTLYGFAYGADGDGEEGFIDDTLYDLIKDNLVEKVNENKDRQNH